MSNLTISGISESGYTLPEGYSWETTSFVNGKKDGIFTVLDNDGIRVAKLEFHNDQLNGECVFYESGRPKHKITYVNNIRNGWACDIIKGNKTKWVLYNDHGEIVSEMRQLPDSDIYWEEIDTNTRETKSICRYDKDHKKRGKGYLFKDNQVTDIVMFNDNDEYRSLKHFENGIMMEYDNDGSIIFTGGFENSFENDYPRCGEGILRVNGRICYKGCWKNDKRDGKGTSYYNGLAYYEGYWKNDVPHGYGCLYENIDDEEIMYEGNWEEGILVINENDYFDYSSKSIIHNGMSNQRSMKEEETVQASQDEIPKKEEKKTEVPLVVPAVDNYDNKITIFEEEEEPQDGSIEDEIIQSEDELLALLNDEMKKQTVTHLTILEDSCNEIIDDITISGFERLLRISIRENSLRNLSSLTVSNNPQLLSITTSNSKGYSKEDNSFNAACEDVTRLVISSRFMN